MNVNPHLPDYLKGRLVTNVVEMTNTESLCCGNKTMIEAQEQAND